MTSRSTKRSPPTTKSRHSPLIEAEQELQSIKQTWQSLCDEEELGWTPQIVKLEPNLPKLRDQEGMEFQLYVSLDEDPSNASLKQIEVIGHLQDSMLANALGRFIASFSTLRIIKLPNCGLRTESIVLLGYFMKVNQSVKELTLDSNPISGEDFSPVVNENNSLEFLSLRMCEITCKGAALLAEVFKSENTGLLYLNLNTNMIGCAGATALAQGLKWNKKLYGISLAGNRIEEEGAKAFGSVLREFVLSKEDVKMRQARLVERAVSVRNQVYNQKESYLKMLPPMPSLPSISTVRDLTKKSDVALSTSVSKKRSKSSTGKRPGSRRKSTKARKEASAHELDYNFQFSTSSIRPQTVAVEDECRFSDNESMKEFDIFAEELSENYDLSDNEREYKLDMLCNLAERLEGIVGLDRHPLISRVKGTRDGRGFKSYGNDHFGYLNLSYNLLPESTLQYFVELLKYQIDAGFRLRDKGIKTLFLKGNLYLPTSPFLAEIKNLLETNNFLT